MHPNQELNCINSIGIDSHGDPYTKTYGYKASLFNQYGNSYVVYFGSTFFIYQLLNEISYDSKVLFLFNIYTPININIVKSIIIYGLVCGEPYTRAETWQKRDFISLIFPNLDLSSQRVSEYLRHIGSPTLRLNFFKAHIGLIKDVYNLLKLRTTLGSTPFDNKCNLYILRYYRHGNDKHNGFRLIVAIQIPTGLPLYYEIVPGNVVDQILLNQTVENLNHLGCKVEYFTGDAAFSNISTIERLIFIDSIESFTTRMNSNYSIFNNVVEKNRIFIT